MTIPILEIGNAEEMADISPFQKLIVLVLLLAVKDRASQARFQAKKDKCSLSYVVNGKSHELVPISAEFGTEIIRALEAFSGLKLPTEFPKLVQLRIGRNSIWINVEIMNHEDGKEAVIHIPDPGETAAAAQNYLKSWLNRTRQIHA